MIVLITGCSSGIGRTLCQKMKREGHTVIATARDVKTLNDLEADGKYALDVTEQKSVNLVVDDVKKHYKQLDLLVNNAGFSKRGAIEEMDLICVNQLFEVNVYGVIRMIQAFAPLMREQKSGKIINIGSVSGRYTQAANGCYCATKHALEAVSLAAREELKPLGIQVSVLEPGAMETEFFHTLEKNSNVLMENQNSPYYEIYQKNASARKNQKRSTKEAAVEEIYRICNKTKLKRRYFVAVPILNRIYICLNQ